MEKNIEILNFVSELNILNEDSIYLENGKLKIDRAVPYKNIRCDGHTIDNPDLTEKEIEHVEENCQEWILAKLIARVTNQKETIASLTEEKN
jgi:hypothetical protein